MERLLLHTVDERRGAHGRRVGIGRRHVLGDFGPSRELGELFLLIAEAVRPGSPTHAA